MPFVVNNINPFINFFWNYNALQNCIKRNRKNRARPVIIKRIDFDFVFIYTKIFTNKNFKKEILSTLASIIKFSESKNILTKIKSSGKLL